MRMMIRIRDPGIFLTLDPGWKKFRSVILEKQPGSATLHRGLDVQYFRFVPTFF
jgi:hypothetical protein